MTATGRGFRRGRYIGVILVFVCVCVVSLLAFAFRATREWRRSSELLLMRELDYSSDLLITAVVRDMQGAQTRVLANRDWSESSISLADTSAQVATAFARYPYPESFFQWRARDPDTTFFHRSDRLPAWSGAESRVQSQPVFIDMNPASGQALRQAIDAYAASRTRYLALNTALGGQPYQVIARLTYLDAIQSKLHSVTGFTVNLAWARHAYFNDLFTQVTPIATRRMPLTVELTDEDGGRIWGSSGNSPQLTREFPFLFLDPTLGRVTLAPDSKPHIWTVHVSPSGGSPLQLVTNGAEETILVAGTAAFVLCLGLVLSVRAVQDRATIAEMRSEFVSSVTHELKMPLANIRAVADTLTLRTVPGEKIRTYGSHLRQEARRLTRLVDNLLAYARITDVANVYTFEPVVPARLVTEALAGFQQPLAQGAFTVDVSVPDGLPLVRVDRAAIRLVFDNLLDNAIRYSPDTKWIQIVASEVGQTIVVEIHDAGTGIRPEDLPRVREKFVRGRAVEPGGTGLGLAIVSRIVADHSGTFSIDSTWGSGTIARLSLPIYRE